MRRLMLEESIVPVNLHDETTDIKDNWLSSGVMQPYTGWSCTDFIPVEPGYYLIRNRRTNIDKMGYNYTYDVDKNGIDNFYIASHINQKNFTILKIREADKYIRCSGNNNQLNGLEIYKVK